MHVKVRSEEQFSCNKCTRVFDSLERLRRHVREHHQFSCIYCPIDAVKSFETEKGLSSHHGRCHPSLFPYKCSICPRSFKRKDDLCQHKQTNHIRGNEVKCDFCPKKLMSVYEKDNHIKKHHSDRRYHCFLCTEYRTTSATNLKRHTKEKHPGQQQP
ncbi:zinc finger and BTB domain-containing protein 16-like [Contarinia nasturtii]|uniref:zinc finger and BTB domain-containing protein 16-like n=1 Tax=Contarinia nasturtii TaxID=265458 RepID=UPI0012D42691|nr:zinc finger and BTB domain-containing protein 16-like [Contarinia nasturtii]